MSLKFNKLIVGNRFSNTFENWIKNNEIIFSSKGFIDIYAPNGVGKSSFAKALKKEIPSEYEYEYNEVIYTEKSKETPVISLVALVLFKAVLRILLRELPHQPVTGDLRDDGRRRDGRDLCVTRHHALVRKVEPLRAVAVHIDKIRRSCQTVYRLPHRTEGRL